MKKKLVSMILTVTIVLASQITGFAADSSNLSTEGVSSDVRNEDVIELITDQDEINSLIQKGRINIKTEKDFNINQLESSEIVLFGTSIPTRYMRLSDYTQDSSYYYIRNYIYSNYNYYPHEHDRDIYITIEPNTNHKVGISVYDSTTDRAISGHNPYTMDVERGGYSILRINPSLLNSNRAYYIKFSSPSGQYIDADYSIT